MTLTLTIYGRLTKDVADFAEASFVYVLAQKLSGEGASTFPSGYITNGDDRLARVTFNGRVWLLDKAERDGVLVYCPASADRDEGRPDVFNEGRESVWGKKTPNPYAPKTVEHVVFERGAEMARGCYA